MALSNVGVAAAVGEIAKTAEHRNDWREYPSAKWLLRRVLHGHQAELRRLDQAIARLKRKRASVRRAIRQLEIEIAETSS